MKKSDKTIAEKLSKAKLRNPKGLTTYIKRDLKNYNPKHVKPRFIDTLELYHGKLLKRTWAYRKSNNVVEILEIVRKLQGLNCSIVGDVETGFMGRRVYFGGSWNWSRIEKKDTYEFYAPLLPGNEKLIEELYPFNSYDIYKNSTNYYYDHWFDYICKYAEYPQIEFLVKRGYGFLVKDVRYLNLKEKQIEKITGIPNQFIDYCKWYSVKTIRSICKKQKPKDNNEMNFILSLNGYPRVQKYYRSKMAEYVNEMNIGYYDDYLRMAEQLGYDLKKSSILFPDNITAAHEKAMSELEIVKCMKKDVDIQKRSEKLEKYRYENRLYCVVIPQSSEDFIKESKELHHCVKSYIDSHIKGETNVYFIRNKELIEKPFVTVEVKSNKLTQYRTEHNQIPGDEVKQFIKEWCKKKRIECSI